MEKRIGRVRLWSNLEKRPLTPNLLFYIEDTESTDEDAIEALSECTEKLGIGEADYGESTHGPVM